MYLIHSFYKFALLRFSFTLVCLGMKPNIKPEKNENEFLLLTAAFMLIGSRFFSVQGQVPQW